MAGIGHVSYKPYANFTKIQIVVKKSGFASWGVSGFEKDHQRIKGINAYTPHCNASAIALTRILFQFSNQSSF